MVLRRGFVVCLMIAALAMAAMADEAPLTFKVGDGAPTLTVTVEQGQVRVRDVDRERTWNIPFDEEMTEPVDGERMALFSAVDMNFDGHLDLQVLSSRGSHNAYYDCYLWNGRLGTFQKDKDLGEVSNPIFDGARERVTGFCHVSATDHSEAEYGWTGEKLTLLWQRGLSYDDEAERFIVVEERRFTEGQIERYLEGRPSIDERLAGQIRSAARALLGSDIVGEGRLHGEALTEGKEIGAWLFDLESGELACFEVTLDGSLYLNRGTEEGTFPIEFGEEITLGERVY